jgi:hypothetical protein
MHRVQVYNWDMGLFRKSYIMFADVEKVNETNFTKYQRAFILPDNDPYGHTLPESFDGYIRE